MPGRGWTQISLLTGLPPWPPRRAHCICSPSRPGWRRPAGRVRSCRRPGRGPLQRGRPPPSAPSPRSASAWLLLVGPERELQPGLQLIPARLAAVVPLELGHDPVYGVVQDVGGTVAPDQPGLLCVQRGAVPACSPPAHVSLL